jgi:hypothetical protein
MTTTFRSSISPGPLFSRRSVTATMALGRGRSSLSSALVVVPVARLGTSGTPHGDVWASDGTRLQRR